MKEGPNGVDRQPSNGLKIKRGDTLWIFAKECVTWEFETLTPGQAMFSHILQPYSGLDTKNTYPIPNVPILD